MGASLATARAERRRSMQCRGGARTRVMPHRGAMGWPESARHPAREGFSSFRVAVHPSPPPCSSSAMRKMGLGRKAGEAVLRLRWTGALCGGVGGWRPERPWLSRPFAGHRLGRCYLFLATQPEEQEI